MVLDDADVEAPRALHTLEEETSESSEGEASEESEASVDPSTVNDQSQERIVTFLRSRYLRKHYCLLPLLAVVYLIGISVLTVLVVYAFFFAD